MNISPYPAMPLLLDPPSWNKEQPTVSTTTEIIGNSVLGNNILLYKSNTEPRCLVLGGVHGDESEGVFLATRMIGAHPQLWVVPCLNLDGALLRQRWNANNVDLNRNLPTADWSPQSTITRYPPGSSPASEPENKALLTVLERYSIKTIFSIHSYKHALLETKRATFANNLDALCADFCAKTGILYTDDIGYPTPGSLGSFSKENNLRSFTYELRRGMPHQEIEDLRQPLTNLLANIVAASA